MSFVSQASSAPLGAPTRIERCTFIGCTAVIGAYVLLRSIRVPFVQDEAVTYWTYVRTGEFMPFSSHPDANNHFLNSLLGSLAYQLCGASPAALRWGSVLAFPLYAWGAWRLVQELRSAFVRWCTLGALLLCPFLLDYFAQLRGYGPAMAAWVWALASLFAFARSGAPRHVALLGVTLFIAVFSDLSVLALWPFCLGSCVVLWATHARPAGCTTFGALVLAQLALLVFAAHVALFLQHQGLLYIGAGTGFFSVTVCSLVGAILPAVPGAAWPIAVLLVACIGLAGWTAVRNRRWRDARSLLAAVLAADVLGREAMYHVLGTHFPEGRAALHLVPVGILLFAYTIDALGRWRPGAVWAAAVLLVLPLRTVLAANVDHAAVPIGLSVPDRFIADIEVLQERYGRPVLLAGHGHLCAPWAFQQAQRPVLLTDMRDDPLPGDPDDARVVYPWQRTRLGRGYHAVDSCAANGLVLLVRDRPWGSTQLADTLLPCWSGAQEFLDLPIGPFRGAGPYALRFTGDVALGGELYDVRLVIEVHDSTGTTTRYDSMDVQRWWRPGGTAHMDVLRAFRLPVAGSCKLYLWNVRTKGYSLPGVRLRLYQLKDTDEA